MVVIRRTRFTGTKKRADKKGVPEMLELIGSTLFGIAALTFLALAIGLINDDYRHYN